MDLWPTRPISRRRALASAAAGLGLIGCGRRDDPLPWEVDRALASAMRWLIASQSVDGAWRSGTYGALKDGLSLTPAVLKAVAFGPLVEGSEAARRRGAAYLISRVKDDGTIDAGPFGMVYPVYTAAAAILVLSRIGVPGALRARDGWLRELSRRQLTGELGWTPADPGYGGWGYSIVPPIKPDSGVATGPLPDADLSSTLFAVGALRIAGATADDPAIKNALVFVRRCQNDAEDGGEREPSFDDGGFFFSPTDPVRNKAGVAGTDRQGCERYRSYGSATADGLRALLRCGLAPDHPCVVEARGWLERNFSAAHHPGAFEPAREIERDATYFYYAWSLAHAFRALGLREIRRRGRAVPWAEDVCRELIRRQRPDGSWSNPLRASKEDDPLIATPLAAGALGICRTLWASP